MAASFRNKWFLAPSWSEQKRLDVTLAASGNKTGEDGRLYGAVTASEIANAIKAARGIRVDKRKVQLEEPIKSLGTHLVKVEIPGGVVATVKTMVVEQK